MTTAYIESTLLDVPIFASLTPEAVKGIAEHSALINLSSNERLFKRGNPASSFYYLKKGRLKLYRLSENGNEKIIEIIEPGNLVAFTLLFIEGSRYPVNANTLATSEIISIDTGYFSGLLKNSTELCFGVMAAMSRRTMGLIQEIDALSLQSGNSRVASYLLAHTSKQQPFYQLPVSKKTLALLLSVKPETLSRIIRCLTNAGVIKVNDKEIEIIDREGLSTAACVITD